MQLKWWDKPEPQKPDPNEADAMRGQFEYKDLRDRKQQLANVPIVPKTDPQTRENWIDSLRRQRTLVGNGQGALGKDFPHGKTSAIADNQLQMITRIATELPEGNMLRMFMENDEVNYFHLANDRSIERDQPQVVLAYKPMISPSSTIEVQGGQAENAENAKKKP